MTIKAAVNLNQEGDYLVWGGIGYQPDCDYPKGTVIGEEITPAGDNYLGVETTEGKTLFVRHENYSIVEE